MQPQQQPPPLPSPPMTGLFNLGNTCFINACIQIMNHTFELQDILKDQPEILHKKNTPDYIVFSEYKNLKQKMFQEINKPISAETFIKAVFYVARQKNMNFCGGDQHDAQEFLMFLIECLHNTVSRGMTLNIIGNVENNTDKTAVECYKMLKTIYDKEYSEIMDLYNAIFISTIYSFETSKIHSVKPEPFFMLDLPIPIVKTTKKNPIHLQDCFDLFTCTELLEGDNAWFNETTHSKENVFKKYSFWNFPKILIITLKRFSPCGNKKNNSFIHFPIENLNLSKYVDGYFPQKYVYDLFGVCNHMGGVQGGHYNSFVLNAKQEWWLLDDANMIHINDATNIITPTAYCLFYRKK